MTQLSPEAQKVVDAFFDEWDVYAKDDAINAIAAALRAIVNQVVPHEDEAPKATFDCEPRPSYNFKTGKCDGPLGYEHGDYLRRQFRQEKLDICWEQRQQTRAMMLAIVTELEQW